MPVLNSVVIHSCGEILLTMNVNLMVQLKEKTGISKIKRLHPLGTMDMRTKFHINPSNS